MVRKFVESEEIEQLDTNPMVNAKRIDYISEFVDIMCEMTDDQLESHAMTAAIKRVYDALSDFEDVYNKLQRNA